MKSAEKKKKRVAKRDKVTPEQALEFLENFRLMQAGLDEAAQAISIRIPRNILEAYKTKAQYEGRPYQAMMVQALREYLSKTNVTKNT